MNEIEKPDYSYAWKNNYAWEWYKYGLQKKDDEIIKFMVHWIAFNWLFGKYPGNERGKIEAYVNKNYEKLARFDAFSSPAIDVFLDAEVEDVHGSEKQKKAMKVFYETICKGKGKERVKYLLFTIQTVRNNLFHGAKNLHNPRDIELVKASSVILEGYLREVLLDIDPCLAVEEQNLKAHFQVENK